MEELQQQLRHGTSQEGCFSVCLVVCFVTFEIKIETFSLKFHLFIFDLNLCNSLLVHQIKYQHK